MLTIFPALVGFYITYLCKNEYIGKRNKVKEKKSETTIFSWPRHYFKKLQINALIGVIKSISKFKRGSIDKNSVGGQGAIIDRLSPC